MLKKIYEKYKETKERNITEAYVLKKIQLANKRKLEKILTKEKVIQANLNVLKSYKECGINVSPLDIFSLPQEELQKIEKEQKESMGLFYDKDKQINGMYLSVSGKKGIFLGKEYVQRSNYEKIEHTIAHEYGHDLWKRFFSQININRKNGKMTFSKNLKLFPFNKKENKTLHKETHTEDEIRSLEFDEYFQEMFVDSVALYVNGWVDGDIRFFSYSQSCQGETLKKDKEFMNYLEGKLYEIFYDRMFTKGLRQVVAELPFSYNAAKDVFEKRFAKKMKKLKPVN